MDLNVGNYIGIGLIIGGLIVFTIQIVIFIRTIKTKNWVVAEGTVTKSIIGTDDDIFKREYNRMYRAEISYKYKKDSIEYESARVFFGDKIYTDNKRKAEKLLKRFPVGEIVKVYINPLDYNESVLIQGVRVTNIISGIIGLSLIALSIYVFNNGETIIKLMNDFSQISF